MKPYYASGGITIYHGDCRDVLTLVVADVFLTDPPYGIAERGGGDAGRFAKSAYGDISWDDTPEYVSGVIVPAIEWLLANTRAGALTPGLRCWRSYPAPIDVGCFWTPASVTHGPWGLNTFWPIFYYGKDWRGNAGRKPSGRSVTEIAPKLGHPCAKPLKAWTWLLDKVGRAGEHVIDPLAGSGTTLVAAKNLGMRATGVEIEERYCEIAARRLDQEVLELGA